MTKDKTNKEVIEEVVEVIKEDRDNTAPANAPSTPQPTPEQVAAQAKVDNTSAKINAILKEDGMAFQPFMNISQFGITPNIALVPVPEQPKTTEPTPITPEILNELNK